MAALRIIFMGTAELSGDSLRGLISLPEARVLAVVTQPDQPKGRGLKLQASPVKKIALDNHLQVLQPERASDEDFVRELRGLQPDLIAVFAYGQILPQSILELPRFGCLNVHTSLLPKYRGAAPIQWAILNGDSETGVTIMKIDEGMDTGDLLAQAKTPIRPEDDAQTLHDRLGQMGADLLAQTIPDYIAGGIQPRPQPTEGASYAPKIRKQDGRIDWRQPARAIWNRIRAMVPWPGAFTLLPDQPQPRLLKIWRAEVAPQTGAPGEVLRADKDGIIVGCGAESILLRVLQREGGRRMNPREFLAGHSLPTGQRLGWPT